MDNFLAHQRVLVVEDEMLVLMGIECALADLGCEDISTAASVAAARSLLEAKSFDVAMLDVNLGDEQSFEVADVLAKRSIPFLFATGYGKQIIDARFRDRPVLRKPYSVRQLADVLANLLPTIQ